ncbi:RNB domain-containing ribonuclease [bacterium]|nr:RNB domain-containing ribonuclease [bacterium]
MIQPGALVLYKDQLARISSIAEGRVAMELESGESKKVREKDVQILYEGASARIPADLEGGDFETAHAMLTAGLEGRDPVATSWRELAELVFGTFSAASAAACARKARQGGLFAIVEGSPVALSPAEIARLRAKEEEKRLEGSRRSAFIAALKAAMREKSGGAALRDSAEGARYLAELEGFALGSQERCAIAAEVGIAETREAVHQALIDAGLWPRSANPWPARAGCALRPPRLEFPARERPGLKPGRADLRDQDSYAIDNAWSTDPDDAIGFDGERVWVHVADPAAFIPPDSPIDAEALSRGATLYLPEKIVPMLPEGAVGRLGLGLGEVSPALSFGMKVAADGGIEDTTIVPSEVRVRRFSYEKADEALAGGDATLAALDAIAKVRHARRAANGAVDIDLPEVSLKVDGEAVRFVSVPSTRSADIVREMMLLAGEAAARWAYERKLPFTYSSQEAPQVPRSLSRSGEGEEPLSLQYQRRKGMKASIVGTECLAHQGLGLSFYSQVTSPLRRYQDLLAHHQLRALLQGEGAAPLPADEVARRCFIAGQGASATRQAERDSRLHWVAFHLAEHPDWIGQAIVLDAREQDCWIIVPEFGIEASMRTRKILAPDDRLDVRAARVSLALNDITFEPA